MWAADFPAVSLACGGAGTATCLCSLTSEELDRRGPWGWGPWLLSPPTVAPEGRLCHSAVNTSGSMTELTVQNAHIRF